MGYRENSLFILSTLLLLLGDNWNKVIHKYLKLDYDVQPGNSYPNTSRIKHVVLHIDSSDCRNGLCCILLYYVRGHPFCCPPQILPWGQALLHRHIFGHILKKWHYIYWVLQENKYLEHKVEGQEKISKSNMPASWKVLTIPLNIIEKLLYTC